VRITEVQAMNAEKSVLGAMMLDVMAQKTAIDKLEPDDFRNEANRTIFEAMRMLHRDGKPVDFVTVSDAVENTDAVTRIGGLEYLIELNRFVASAANIEAYTVMVQQNAQEARISDGAMRIAQSDDPSIAALERLIEREKGRIKAPAKDGAALVAEYLEELCDGSEKTLFSTGFLKFDTYMGGLPRGSVSCIAARPRIGKTAFALNIMAHNINHGYRTAYFSLEMTAKQLLDRLAAAGAKVPYGIIHRKKPEAGHMAAISEELADISMGGKLNLYDNVRSVNGIITEAERVKADLIFIDYIQRVRPEESRHKRNEEIEQIVYRLKDAAIQLNAHICMLSQISRQGADKPKIEDLKESGALEEGSDIIMLLHRHSDNEGRDIKPTGFVAVAKNKYGDQGYCELWFEGKFQKFSEAENGRG
jgi:replicative DNA helicase